MTIDKDFDEIKDGVLGRNLFYLRGHRDAVAHDLALYVEAAKGPEWIEAIVTWRESSSAARANIEDYLWKAGMPEIVSILHELYHVSMRVARLEREACGIELSGDLRNA